MKRNDHLQKYKDLRKKFSEFCYESFKYDISNNYLNIEYHFSLSGKYDFHPTHQIPVFNVFDKNKISKHELDNLIFHLS